MAAVIPSLVLLTLLPWCGALAWSDMRSRTLPNWLAVWGFALACGDSLCWGTLPAALVGGLVLCGCYLLSYLCHMGIGGGDVKVSGPCGMVAATAGITAWWVVAFGTFVLTAFAGTYMLIRRRRGAAQQLPQGAALALTTAATVLWRCLTTLLFL